MKKSKQSMRLFDTLPLRSETKNNFYKNNKLSKEPSRIQKLTMSAASILMLSGIGASVASNTFLSQEAEMSGISQSDVNPYKNVDFSNLNNARNANDLLAKTTQNSIQHQDIELYQNVVKINGFLNSFTINNNKSNRLQMTYRVYNDILAHKNDSENILRLKLARSYQSELKDDILEQHIDKTITQEMYTLIAQQQQTTPENIKSKTMPLTGVELQNLETYLYGKYSKQAVNNNNIVYQPVKPIQQATKSAQQTQPKAVSKVETPQVVEQSQPVVKPEAPKVVEQTKPAVKPEAPKVIEQTKPTVKPEVPKVVEQTKPTVKPEAPKAEVQQPKAEVQQPKAEVQQPKAEAQQPKAEVQQPKAEVQQPKAEVQQPKAEAQQPKAEAQQPKAHNKYEITYDKNGRIIKTKEFMATFNEAVNKKPKDRTPEERHFLDKENYDWISHDPTANGTVGHDGYELDWGN
ncbi:hypothetical protein [Staphylococcus simulans]|uniref:hypothetical protein n=1 Tax=Staphylococcus simulans TaxID=1286 RepID=UPI0021CEBE9C|nr:hypothetical protein [Staphylococcus simulans]UXV42143.1 hypothetical protein MUA12_11750 [Staphylococcus simulans]